MERWRTGTEKTDAIDGDLRNDPWLSLPEIIPARDFSDLAWLQGERLQSEGRMVEAWGWYRAVNRYSRHVAQRKDCIGRTLGCSLHASTAKRIIRWAGDPETTIGDLQLALKQLDEDFRLTRPFSEFLKVTYVDLPKYVLSQQEWRSHSTLASERWRDSKFVQYCLAEPEVTTRWNKLAIENWLCGGELPRRLQRRIPIGGANDVLDVTATKSDVSGAQILGMFAFTERGGFTSFAATRDYIDMELACQETLRLALACQIRFRQAGNFPIKLEEVISDLLSELPIDPFSRSGAVILYRRDGDEAVVYSLGVDETDDHGSVELIPGKGYSDIGYRIERPRIRDPASEQKAVDEH